MKAAVYVKTKTGKVLEIQDLEQPVPKEHEVLLRVRAASVNPLDWRLKKHRPGVDVAGEVISVGPAVTQFKPGDAVFGASPGAFAEYACASEAKLVPKPESVSFEQAAAVPIAGLTALQGLRDIGNLQAGQRLLINGASGGIGTFAVQIAKSFGASVTGVCSTKNVDLVRSLGADRVIDYTREDFTQDSERFDLLLDNVGNRSLSDMRRISDSEWPVRDGRSAEKDGRGDAPTDDAFRLVLVREAKIQILHCEPGSERSDRAFHAYEGRESHSRDRSMLLVG